MREKLKETLQKSISYIDGDPDIIPYSIIRNQTYGRPNFACGQIKKNTKFGQKINELSLDSKYNNYLEIGTWCGLGTTKCLLDGIMLRNDRSKLISIESNTKFYNITKQYWDKYFEVYEIKRSKFDLKYGSLVTYNQLDEKYVTDSGHTKSTYDYNQDIKEAPLITIEDTIDVLVLDGGHFSTSIEWNLFKSQIQVLVLDDIFTSKTRMILKEIEESPEWTVIFSSKNRNGEFIATRKP